MSSDQMALNEKAITLEFVLHGSASAGGWFLIFINATRLFDVRPFLTRYS